jgi:predicted transposase YbfD/YdcC
LPKKTIREIRDAGNDYIVTLKRNQIKLYRASEAITQTRVAEDCDDRSSCGHGRYERRIVSVWTVSPEDAPAIDADWSGLQRIIRVERLRQRGTGPVVLQTSYYLSSRVSDTAYTLGRLIRAHWGIENSLHWVKDVQQNEDANRIVSGSAPETISLLKTWVLSLFRFNGYHSIKNAMITFANKIGPLMALLRT